MGVNDDLINMGKLARLLTPYEDANGEDPTHPTNLHGKAEWLAVECARLEMALSLLRNAHGEVGMAAYHNADEAHQIRRESKGER